jgi:tripartite ATP-independent transporter DctM subunit
VALPQMLRLGYQRKLAIGTICAGGSLGTMIPPSIILVFYGLTVGTSIGDLFLASFLPGLMLAGSYIVYIMVRCWMDPRLGPPAPVAERSMPLVDKLMLLRGVILPVLVAFSVMGSIYLGLASVTESAALGVAGVVLSAAIRGDLTWKVIRESVHQTMATCGMVFWLVLGTNALIGVYNIMGGIQFAQGLFQSLPFAPLVVVLIMVGVFFVLGCFIDWIGILLLTMPIFVPTIKALGYDPIWFGVVFSMSMQVAYLSPPFAPAAFYLKGVAPPDMTLDEIFNAMWPFIAMQVISLTLLILFPEIALWLPRVL